MHKYIYIKVTAVAYRWDLYTIGQGSWQLGLGAGLFPEVDRVGFTNSRDQLVFSRLESWKGSLGCHETPNSSIVLHRKEGLHPAAPPNGGPDPKC